MATEDRKSLHIVVFPWLAFGHIIPFLELSKLIAQKGHKISFVSSPRNIDRLPKLPPDLASSITLVKIPLPKVAELPENAEATMDVHGGQAEHLKKAFDGLEPELTRLLADSRPDWIIYDFAPHWLPPIAAGFGISRAFFLIMSAWLLAFMGPTNAIISGSDDRTKPEDYMVPPKWIKFETKVAFRRFDANWIAEARQNQDSGSTDFYRVGKVLFGSDAILLRYCYEFEPDWLTVLEELHHKPVLPVGLIPPNVQEDEDDEIWRPIKNWLDTQNKGSVVYVALGSEVIPTRDQLTELAHGLELSGVPFFWVLRKKPSVSTDSDSVELPERFEERITGRGIVWRSWVPQLKILSHESVGGFLTHCGWSSFVEGLMFGHPLITLPFVIDHGLTSMVVTEKQLGIEIPRNEGDCSFTRNSVADSIKRVMLEDDERKFKDRAREISKIFGDKELQGRYTDKFIQFLENFANKDI